MKTIIEKEYHKVSIIIPVYNAEKYLDRCIRSILNQTYNNWEAIFINDGSTDLSLNILNTYKVKESRFRVISKSNGGASSARNMGLDALNSDYFCFVDADDSIHPNFILKMLTSAIDNNCDLVVSGISFKGLGGGLYLSGLVKMSPYQYITCITSGPIAKLFRMKIVKEMQLRFCEDMQYAEDYVFTRSYALLIDKFFAIREPMYTYYYDNENSLDHKFARRIMPYNQYLYCSEAPWRTFYKLIPLKDKISSKLFYSWSYILYNELWRMYYFSCHYLSKEDQKRITNHFKLRHNDFKLYVPFSRRIFSFQRYPRLYGMLKGMIRFVKKIFNVDSRKTAL